MVPSTKNINNERSSELLLRKSFFYSHDKMKLTRIFKASTVSYYNLGKMRYSDALKIQEDLVKRHLKSPKNSDPSTSPNTLLLVEHNPVYTVGIRSNEYTSVDEEFLHKRGAEFFKTSRGGLITFHGPGQLVAYPILNLQYFQPSIRWYVCKLEEVLIRTCREFGVETGRTQHTGIWVKESSKIAAIGIRCQRYITSHGIALNCSTDLSWFDHIIPCGLEGFQVTSLSKELGKNVSVTETLTVFVSKFAEVFGVSVEEILQNQSLT